MAAMHTECGSIQREQAIDHLFCTFIKIRIPHKIILKFIFFFSFFVSFILMGTRAVSVELSKIKKLNGMSFSTWSIELGIF